VIIAFSSGRLAAVKSVRATSAGSVTRRLPAAIPSNPMGGVANVSCESDDLA
jgi:hypothetical protein